MTEVMNSLEPGAEDFSGGGGGGAEGPIFSDSHERFPKLSKRLPSIVVEPMDGAEVESGELRWPPDEPGSPDGPPTEGQSPEEQPEDESTVEDEASPAETQDSN